MNEEEPVVTIQQGKDNKYLSFYCDHCKKIHTIAVRAPGEVLRKNITYWPWNGSYTKPSLGPDCVAHNPLEDNGTSYPKPGLYCHLYFRGTGEAESASVLVSRIGNNGHSSKSLPSFKLLPVSQWPKLTPPPEKQGDDENE